MASGPFCAPNSHKKISPLPVAPIGGCLQDATTAEVGYLKGENERLKQRGAELSLANMALKKGLGKGSTTASGTDEWTQSGSGKCSSWCGGPRLARRYGLVAPGPAP